MLCTFTQGKPISISEIGLPWVRYAVSNRRVWASPLSLAATYGITIVLFSSGYWNVLLPRVRDPSLSLGIIPINRDEFPHSEIFGSKVASHLPEAYRRQATSFIAFWSQGIHHTPLNFLLGNLKTAYLHLSNFIQSQVQKVNFILPHETKSLTAFASALLPGIHLQYWKDPSTTLGVNPNYNRKVVLQWYFIVKIQSFSHFIFLTLLNFVSRLRSGRN